MGAMAPTHLDPEITTTLREAADRVRATSGTRVGDLVEAALLRTLTVTTTVGADDSAFVITGDIPAMWMRDSTAQLTPYLRFLGSCPPLADLVAAVVRRQLACLDHDPYANAFNDGSTGAHYEPDDVCDDPHVWEQKYEIDSLAYPVTLAHALWRSTGRTDVFDERAHRVLRTITRQLRAEQDPDTSAYRCTYGYNVPANLFAAQALSSELVAGVEKFGTVDVAGAPPRGPATGSSSTPTRSTGSAACCAWTTRTPPRCCPSPSSRPTCSTRPCGARRGSSC